MYLLAYRSARHEATGTIPAEMYLKQNLRVPLNLLKGTLPNREENETKNYSCMLRGKLSKIHNVVAQRLDIRSKNVKPWYDWIVRKTSVSQCKSMSLQSLPN